MLSVALMLTLSSVPSPAPSATDLQRQIQMLVQEIQQLKTELAHVQQQNGILEGQNSQLLLKYNDLQQELLILRSQTGQLPVGEAAQLARETAALNYARACVLALETVRIEDAHLSLDAYNGASCTKLMGAQAARFTTIAAGTVNLDPQVLDGYRLTITQKDGKGFDYVNRRLQPR